MTVASPVQTPSAVPVIGAGEKIRRAAKSQAPEILTGIYEDETNIVVWQRELSQTLQTFVSDFLKSNPTFQTSLSVTPQSAITSVNDFLGASTQNALSEDIAELVDMFCCLFDLKRAGLRLTALDHAMCPRFHVDKVPCRLVTTYQGASTEWLPHQLVNRAELGRKSQGKSDHQSGLFKNQYDIQQLSSGDVALLKGELWEGNENAGLVHRSPTLSADENRLLLTLDFMNE